MPYAIICSFALVDVDWVLFPSPEPMVLAPQFRLHFVVKSKNKSSPCKNDLVKGTNYQTENSVPSGNLQTDRNKIETYSCIDLAAC
jgi:hypothetical protein